MTATMPMAIQIQGIPLRLEVRAEAVALAATTVASIAHSYLAFCHGRSQISVGDAHDPQISIENEEEAGRTLEENLDVFAARGKRHNARAGVLDAD